MTTPRGKVSSKLSPLPANAANTGIANRAYGYQSSAGLLLSDNSNLAIDSPTALKYRGQHVDAQRKRHRWFLHSQRRNIHGRTGVEQQQHRNDGDCCEPTSGRCRGNKWLLGLPQKLVPMQATNRSTGAIPLQPMVTQWHSFNIERQ